MKKFLLTAAILAFGVSTVTAGVQQQQKPVLPVPPQYPVKPLPVMPAQPQHPVKPLPAPPQHPVKPAQKPSGTPQQQKPIG